MKQLSRLEALAIDAHRRGTSWATFWETHRHTVGSLEPYDRAAYRRIVARLSHLLTCGDTGGMVPIDAGFNVPMDWELDDTQLA